MSYYVFIMELTLTEHKAILVNISSFIIDLALPGPNSNHQQTVQVVAGIPSPLPPPHQHHRNTLVTYTLKDTIHGACEGLKLTGS